MLTLLKESQTGIRFTNTITEDDSLHVMKYEYLYNGHGIGVADFDGDGWLDLFFSGNNVPNKLFLNTKGFTFKDITSEAGVKGNDTWRTGVSIADVNGDGMQDIYVCHSGKYSNEKDLANELYINKGLKNGIPYFEEAAKQYGLDAPGTQSTQAAFFDYDRDGDLDMFLLNHSNHTYNPYLNTRKVRATPHHGFGNRLFRNDRRADGSSFFTDVTLAAGIINNALNFGLSVTISDMNGDGWPDIYTTSDYTEQDCYYVNKGDGTFRQALQQSFTHISKYSMGADIADYNNDGRPDVITLDMLPEDNYRQKLLKGPDEYDAYHLLLDSGYYHQQMRNMLHLNSGIDAAGNVRFREIGQLAGISNTDWSWAPLLADMDNDGWKDLVVTNGYLRDFTDLDFLKYTVANTQLEEASKGNINFRTFDLVKKMPSNKLTNYVFRNNGDLTFSDKSREWGFTQPSVSGAAVYADLDNDSDLDLVIGNNNEPVMLYRNNANEQLKNQFIKVEFKGKDANTAALGAKVWLFVDDKVQYAEQYPVRGYQSSVAPMLIFGLGTLQQADSLVVQWPDGSFTSKAVIPAGAAVVLTQNGANRKPVVKKNSASIFSDVTATSGLHFRHQENEFIDFKDEVLLPYQLSKMGPAMAKADVNGDGLEDVFIGGAIGQPGKLFLQQPSGSFTESGSQPWEIDRESEDVKALFFDADKDGNADLYVVSGGNEYGDGSPEFADRFYRNDGKGNFMKITDALPAMISSKQTVAAGDMDGDGDLDLFIGGSAIPGSFPLAARSYLLRNDSKNGDVRFTDVTEAWSKDLLQPGIVTTAVWQDLDKDGLPELLISGEWMPLQLFKNNKEKLLNISDGAGLTNTNGLWSSLLAGDVDGDGDIDFVAGNSGLNNQFRASLKEPMTLHTADFDDNGTLDAITCYYIQGKSYPMASRDELLDQIVPLRKKFVKYKDYAGASLQEIFPKNKLAAADVKSVYQLASCLLINDGKNRFTLQPLPTEAQFSKVFGMIAGDMDKDGKKDLLLAGNFFPYRVQLGRNDAGLGVWLKGDGAGNYKTASNEEAGLFIGGDVRNLISVVTKNGETLLIIGKNNDAVQVLKLAR
ncbi:MAG TPA: VCBS repeat-containing protein [Flavisolibacter sp.]|nr:VCBS repeat-containing protein [Flavisolibacter sp.]